ncbi:hypothetical protein TrVE_jg6962 [Triparma verrucosa]|uniref:Sulfatase N-terminal domain-containing protein n=1 Tax=Triparma verrucosa TaxID=1606542 RepID=A0A9W7ERW2_9STRA|nr:hypothetical protein TrVE_jg6962 [Triparma verrucosa]
MNVLFIANDDLRPMIPGMKPEDSPYDYMVTPNLDKFIEEAVTFTNAHVQFAECGPSRASILFGRRPDTTQVYDLYNNPRETMNLNAKTIPELFKDEGYYTVGVGKIFHDGHSSNNSDPVSWSTDYGDDYFMGSDNYPSCGGSNSWMAVDEDKTGQVQDSTVRDRAVELLTNFSKGTDLSEDQPFFLAVGLRKPHLPFIVPQEFYDLYPKESIELTPNDYAPWDMPSVAYASWELQGYQDVADTNFTGQINETLDSSKALEEVRGYQAAVSYTDHNVGVLLDTLKDLNLQDNTIVVYWGDHGWKLGHHGAWCKHTNFREDTNSPIIIRVPGASAAITDSLIEHVDLAATLADIAGLTPLPTCPANDPGSVDRCTEGQSFKRLIEDPSLEWKNASYSQYIRGKVMGYSMTTKTARFTAWVAFDTEKNVTDWSNLQAEYYEHTTDPLENRNLANLDEFAADVAEMFEQVKAGWRATSSTIKH